MKEITILSGKGGTGKTSITAAIASLAQNAVFCDNDVDAADLHLILTPKIQQSNTFIGARIAKIDQTTCTNCGLCYENCRFDSIEIKANKYLINPIKCEGCRLCEHICPAKAIETTPSLENSWFISETRYGKMVHAQMGPGEENSGKLVAKIREESKALAKKQQKDWIINDGPPGIGCTTISAITGTNHVLLIIEASVTGFHDIQRVIELTNYFNVSMSAIINKFSLNGEISTEIEQYLKRQSIPLLAKIPFDNTITEAQIVQKTIIEYAPKNQISKIIKSAWEQLQNQMKSK